jgi:RES domain-containing protein
MLVYRITKLSYLTDLSGTGARLYGGRWNSEGVAVLYTASSFSLALLETMAHTALDNIPQDFGYLAIDCPEPGPGKSVLSMGVNDLPEDWQSYPAPFRLQEIGDRWAKSGEHLYLRVPSVIVALEDNWLLNPMHPAFAEVRVHSQGRVPLDSRVVAGIKGE